MEQWTLLGFRGAVEQFKRCLIETALRQSAGNRTRAARSLGLQRTYLLRLIRDFGVSVPRSVSFPGAPAHPARPASPPPAREWLSPAREKR